MTDLFSRPDQDLSFGERCLSVSRERRAMEGPFRSVVNSFRHFGQRIFEKPVSS